MKVLFLLVLVIAVEGNPGRAHATDADALVRQGIDLRRSHRDEEALKLFQQAYELEQAPRTLAQMGFAEQALGKWAIADRHLHQARLAQDDRWIQKNRGAIDAAIKLIATHVGGLGVSGTPDGAEVRVDGELVGRLPISAPISVAAGRVAVEVRASGYLSIVRAATVTAGELTRENFNLQLLSQGAGTVRQDPPPGTSATGSTAGATAEKARAPADAVAIHPAAEVVGSSSSVSPPPTGSSPSSPDPVDAPASAGGSSRTVLVVGAAGLAVVALTAGIIEHLAWQRNVNSFENTAGCDPSLPEKGGTVCNQHYEDGRTAKTFTFIGYGLTAAFMTTAAILYLTAPAPNTQPAKVACAVSPTAPGLGCAFRF